MAAIDPKEFLYSGNQLYVAELYERYLDDPGSVDHKWQEFFSELADTSQAFGRERQGASWASSDAEILDHADLSTVSEQMARDHVQEDFRDIARKQNLQHTRSTIQLATRDSIRALMLIRSYRVRGHLGAVLDPLGLDTPKEHPELDPFSYGFTEKDLDKWIKILSDKTVIAVDTETSSLNPIETELVGISFSFDENKACYIPLGHKNIKGLKKELALKKIKPILEDVSIKKVGQNMKFDYIVLKQNGIDMNSIEDTMLISYTLDAGTNRHNLDTLSEIHLNHKPISYKELVGTGKKQKNFSDIELKKATEYAAEDADITLRLYNFLISRLNEEKLNKIYETFEKPMVKLLSKLELNGVKVDDLYLKKLSKRFQDKLRNIEKEIYSIARKEFNIGSPKQLGEIIYKELKIAKLKKTKKGGLATSAKILEDLALTGHKFPNLVLEWRQVSKLKSTYTDALQEHINKRTKRVHTSFLLAATNTGRLASSDPNLQNIPIKTLDGKKIRKAFTAEKNNILISADYNQIEMRILADMADVKELKKAFKNNQDIHSLTASQVFDVPIAKVTDDFRRKAKAINFGIIYGITQYGLAKQISVSNEEALSFINSYFKKFPEIKDYMNTTIKTCRKQGFVTNIFGRRIHLRGINDKNFSVRAFQERAAINAPIQGSAADIIRLAMIKIDKVLEEKKKAKMLLQIHDELIFECLKKDESEVKKIVKEAMTSVSSSDHHMFSIPLEVSINSGNNWGEAH